jgi:hypothetical protein
MNTGFVERHTNPQLDEQSDTSLSSFNGYLHKVRATLRDLVSGRIRAVIEGAKLPKERFQLGPLRIAMWHRRELIASASVRSPSAPSVTAVCSRSRTSAEACVRSAPSLARPPRPESAERPQGASKRFVGRVFGFLAVVQDDIRGCQGLVLVSRDELSVRVKIAASRELDELGIIGGGM